MKAPDAIWYGKQPVPWYLAALEKIYQPLSQLHQKWRRARAGHPGVPVVVVGNLTVGGSGKTPLLIHLVNQLKSELKIGVVSRGYGSTAGRGPRPVNAQSDASTVGDEPLMIWRQTGVPVMVGSDRLTAARALAEQHSLSLIFSDDGLQHHQLARDMEIVVVDFARGFGNGKLLPAGPLREPLSRLKSVDFVVENGNAESMTLLPGNATPLDCQHSEQGREQNLSKFNTGPVHALAGIGHPQRFFDMLRTAGLSVIAHPFDDHHAFGASDVESFKNETVLTTAKDAVKLTGLGLSNCWVVPVSVQLTESLSQSLMGDIRAMARAS